MPDFCADASDDFCCWCADSLPPSVADWYVGYGHMFCSLSCANEWLESANA